METDRDLHVILEGKTAELVRQECKERQMGHDQLVRDIIWAWHIDLIRERRDVRPLPARQPVKPRRSHKGRFATRTPATLADSPLGQADGNGGPPPDSPLPDS